MKPYQLIAIAAFAIMGITNQSVLAQHADVRSHTRETSFIGLWVGIDPEDGGNTQRSITRDKDGKYQVIGGDTVITLCDRSFFGVATGTGVIENGVLIASTTLQCFNNGRTMMIEERFVPDPENGTLTVSFPGQNIPPIVFHNISNRPD